jgi:hypothetical protein
VGQTFKRDHTEMSDSEQLILTSKWFMSSRPPAEDENSTANTPHDVMLSASEASAFQFRDKADSSASPQNDIQGAPSQRSSRSFNSPSIRNLRGLRPLRVERLIYFGSGYATLRFCCDLLTIGQDPF